MVFEFFSEVYLVFHFSRLSFSSSCFVDNGLIKGKVVRVGDGSGECVPDHGMSDCTGFRFS